MSTSYPSVCTTNKELEAFMREELKARSYPLHMEKTVHLAASLIEVGTSPRFLIYVDGEAKDITAFQERFLRHQPQVDPVLDGLASTLHSMFDFYPASFASSIINATFDFISGNCIERALEKQLPSPLSPQFPWFLRHSTDASVAYALMLFPNSRKADYVACFQALADMDFWISASNDLLSYHKESTAGETANYISIRGAVEARSPLKVASDIKQELLHSRKHVYMILTNKAGEGAPKAWRTWERGYM
ncbi:hypothetical protein DXG01_002549 [Tephrocybe rancida]|nr:hypothetical protein DXG01_002549 [Tephrocybe rancida]